MLADEIEDPRRRHPLPVLLGGRARQDAVRERVALLERLDVLRAAARVALRAPRAIILDRREPAGEVGSAFRRGVSRALREAKC